MALSRRAGVKAILRIPSAVTQDDALIDALLDAGDQAGLGYLGLAGVTQQAVDEVYDCDTRQDRVKSRYSPINSVTALTDNGSAVSSSDFYTPRSGSVGYIRLKTTGAFFTPGKQTVQATLNVGWADSSPGLTSIQAAFEHIVASMYEQGGHSGMESEKLGNYSYKLDEGTVPPVARGILNSYRRVGFM